MNDINRLLIFLLLIGLLYALYRYQHLIFGKELIGTSIQDNPTNNKPERTINKEGYVSVDNISQVSLGSLDDEDGRNNELVYKPDSILGSLDTNSLFGSDGGSIMSGGSLGSNNSSFFF